MLSQMNLLLHGLESPRITKGNSLEQKLTEIKDSDRVDVILTNPPFGGEEERGILGNFPEDKQTAETALLFLQLIMRKLRVTPKSGRAAVVVPNGILFGDGISARIKQELLTKFNLHTIIRLPNGIFAPYTSIPTNILFFDRTGPTKDIWYFEIPLPDGRKNFTKSAPIQIEDLAGCIAWWRKRSEGPQAWQIAFNDEHAAAHAKATPHWKASQDAETRIKALRAEIEAINDRISDLEKSSLGKSKTKDIRDKFAGLESSLSVLNSRVKEQLDLARTEKAAGDAAYWPVFNLDRKNPAAKENFEHLPPEQLAEDILRKELRIADIMREIQGLLGRKS